MIQDVPREEMEQRVKERVRKELEHANRVLSERNGIDPYNKAYLKAKAVIQYSYDHHMSIEEARAAIARLDEDERRKVRERIEKAVSEFNGR